MNLRLTFGKLLFAALMAGIADGSRADDAAAPAASAAPAAKPAAAKQEYDAIFSDILQSLPQEKRALVDSAHGAKGVGPQATPPANPGNGNGKPTEEEKELARQAAKAKRSEAIQALPPEVRSRVDKAITDLDNRRKEKQAELKELGK